MSITGQPRKQFCIKGHDTHITGRATDNQCRVCKNTSQRRRELQRCYGLTPEDFNRMRINQLNKCAICKRDCNNLYVDHNHKTGKVRALLCRSCNFILGLAKENPGILAYAAAYILEYRSKQLGDRLVDGV